jgi:predicted molibdopterin-dependent oxidoreductase YjgC
VSAEETVAIIGKLENDYHGVFEKSAIKKATRFQGVQQVFINDPFANLMGRDTNHFERTSNKYYFLLTGLYDDIIDQKLISETALDQLFDDPINTKATIF